MITEQMLVDAVRTVRGRSTTFRSQAGGQARDSNEVESSVTDRDTLPTGEVYRGLLRQYALAEIDAVLGWLSYGGYLGYTGYGLATRMAVLLTPKGVRLADTGQLDPEELDLVYQEDPYAAFVARQFRKEDDVLYDFLARDVLAPLGIEALDGQVDGIEAFRGEILRKIRRARYFICLLTHRAALQDGTFASSVWLYQETGAAVALGKKPLVLVEDGMDAHFAGELQKNYEYILFARSAFESAFREAGRKIVADLVAHSIPRRAPASVGDGR